MPSLAECVRNEQTGTTRGCLGRGVHGRARGADRPRLAQPRPLRRGAGRLHVRHAVRRPSASPTATRCGCSGRRRACTGGAAGRSFLAPRHLGRQPRRSSCSRAGRRRSPRNRFIFRRGRPARAGALAASCGAACSPPRSRSRWSSAGSTSRPCPATSTRTAPTSSASRPATSRSTRSSAFLIFHGLVWASFLVIAGVMLALRRRMRDHGAAAVQQFGEDFLPLILLFAISVTGLMLTASYTWMKGYAYDFLAILHAVTVIFTLLWLPFGKFFHIFQRPAQLGVELLQGRRRARASRRTAAAAASRSPRRLHVEDLIDVERELGLPLRDGRAPAEHYQQICPRCRRALFGLAQGAPVDREPTKDGDRWPAEARRRPRDHSTTFGPHRLPAGARGSTPRSSPTGWSRRTAASAASSAASSSRSRTTRSSASSRGRTSRSTAACSARRASSATCRARTPTGC